MIARAGAVLRTKTSQVAGSWAIAKITDRRRTAIQAAMADTSVAQRSKKWPEWRISVSKGLSGRVKTRAIEVSRTAVKAPES